MKTILTVAVLMITSFVRVTAQPVKRIYIANDDHTDYMWTANEAQYDSAFVHMLDYYLDQVEATKNNPDDFQARFNCDGSYWLKVYNKYRSPAQFNRLVSAIRSKHISVPLNSLVSTYGAQPTEAVIRGMFDAGRLERRLGLRFRMAVCMENQTLPLGLSALWSGSGARYSWRGVCACASKIPVAFFRNRRNQLYNYTGLDSSRVIMKWYNLGENNTYLGGYAEARAGNKPKDTLASILSVIEDLDSLCIKGNLDGKYPFSVAGAFGYGWDDLATFVSPEFIKAAQITTNNKRKIRVSNEEDFFEDITKTYFNLPTETVSYGNEWDLYSVSMNEITARVRRATEKLRNAEAIASVASLHDPSFLKPLNNIRDLAWESYGLYWEHDWTADGPVSRKDRANWQIKIQQQISAYSDTLLRVSVAALGSQIRSSAQTRFFVFNSLSWVRTDFADFKYNGPYPVKVIDIASGKETVSQLIRKGSEKYLRILAAEMPPVGYKTFEIRKETPTPAKQAAQINGAYISNKYYRIRLSPSGAITELYDGLAKGRQLVKSTNGRYLNDLGASDINTGNTLAVENAGPVSVTFKAVSPDPVPHTVRVTLFAHSPRIQIEDSIQSNFSDVKTWAFSFGLEEPNTRHEELGSVITAKKETRGGHYASVNARYDWLTFNHFANLSERNYGVTLSNMDCSFFKLGGSTPDSLWESSSQINALAGGQTDNSPGDTTSQKSLGIVAQNGDSSFLYQFALSTHQKAFDAVKAMKFSMEHQNPFVTGNLTGSKKTTTNNSFSLLSISDPSVLLWSVKPAEDGIDKGLVTRFWNLSEVPASPVIKFKHNIKRAWKTTHIETDEMELKPAGSRLRVNFNQYQINTFRLLPEKN